jgi:hypothetical protein
MIFKEIENLEWQIRKSKFFGWLIRNLPNVYSKYQLHQKGIYVGFIQKYT